MKTYHRRKIVEAFNFKTDKQPNRSIVYIIAARLVANVWHLYNKQHRGEDDNYRAFEICGIYAQVRYPLFRNDVDVKLVSVSGQRLETQLQSFYIPRL